MSKFNLAHVTASAVTPDQLLPYVAAVSSCRTQMVGDYICHIDGQNAVLVAYPLHNAMDTSRLENTVREALALPDIEHLTVIAPIRPANAPKHAISIEDTYWAVDLPPPAAPAVSTLSPLPQKLRNILRRATRDVTISTTQGQGAWTAAHEALVAQYIRTRPFEPGMRHIFSRLGIYVDSVPHTRVFSAHTADGALTACAIGDFSALGTAFYMFAFRQPTAPPGTADALLHALLLEGNRNGHSRCNLGLGIGPGVAFFKQKWQAYAYLPCVQTTCVAQKQKTSWLQRLLQ